MKVQLRRFLKCLTTTAAREARVRSTVVEVVRSTEDFADKNLGSKNWWVASHHQHRYHHHHRDDHDIVLTKVSNLEKARVLAVLCLFHASLLVCWLPTHFEPKSKSINAVVIQSRVVREPVLTTIQTCSKPNWPHFEPPNVHNCLLCTGYARLMAQSVLYCGKDFSIW